MMRQLLLAAVAAALAASPAAAQTAGVAVQVSNGKAIPTGGQLAAVLRPGDFVRDILGWHKADPHCDLTSNPARQIQIPPAMATLYAQVEAAGGRNFVTLGFNNPHCGQATPSGAKAFPDTPALRAEFAAYAAEVVRRVPALGGISLWNEMNGTWDGGYRTLPQKLTNYCLLANDVIGAVRKVDGKIPIAIGATVGWDIDDWFIGMFDTYGCIGKGDPGIWLDVHPYLSGAIDPKRHKVDWTLWRAAVANSRQDGITNPFVATEWGARAASQWSKAHPKGNYMTSFQNQVAETTDWAGSTWFEMLYDSRSPNAGLFDKSGTLTVFGAQYQRAFAQ